MGEKYPKKTFMRALGAVPDGLTASFFLTAWIAPLYFGEGSVRNGMLIMLVEFILVHASGFIGSQMLDGNSSRKDKALFVLGFGALYLLFISAWAWTFHAWWPFLAFGWLLVGKFATAVDTRITSEARKLRMQSDWALGVFAYLGGTFLTVMLPVPRFGITPDVVHGLHLPGSGLWVDEPQRVMAFGVIYFSVLAWVKLKDYNLPAAGLRPTRRNLVSKADRPPDDSD